ncbi:hypothetical protein HZA97_06815 [Candidatus Woesearchaeota archaeon]|nr:hypothetical protein [Candidatus Woesearchaeota archaeon]
MDLNTIVYGVGHSRENAESVIELVSKDIQKEDKIGIEVTPKDIKFYEQISKEGLTIKEAEERLANILFKESSNFRYDKTQESLDYFLSGHGFFLRVYQALSPLCSNICGLDSQRSNFLRLASKMYDLESFHLLLKAYGCNELELKKVQKCSWPTLVEILRNTHANNHFVKKIQEEKCTKAILGFAHTIDIKAISNFKIVYSWEHAQKYEAELTKSQAELRKKYTEYGFLPDLTDKLEDADKIKDIPFGAEEELTPGDEKEIEILQGYVKLLREQGPEGKDVVAYEEKHKNEKLHGQPAIRMFYATKIMVRAMDLLKEKKPQKE